MLFIFSLLVLVSPAWSAESQQPLLLPLDVIAQIKKDFGVQDTSDKIFVRKNLIVHILADQKAHQFTFNENKPSHDFSYLGFKTKSYTVRFESEPPKQVPAAPPPGEASKKEESASGHGSGETPSPAAEPAEKSAAHGGTSGGHEPPAAEHGAPAGGHGSPSTGGSHGSEGGTPVPAKTVYFINRYKEDKVGGHTLGLPCGKALKLQSHLDALFGEQGIKVDSAGGRHLDMFGGDFVVVETEGDNIFVSFASFRDKRFAQRICTEIPKKKIVAPVEEKKESKNGHH